MQHPMDGFEVRVNGRSGSGVSRTACLCVIAALLLLWGHVPAKAETCRALMQQYIADMKATDSAALRALIPKIDETCPSKYQVSARRNLGMLHAREAAHRLEQGEPSSVVAADLERYESFGDHWELRRIRGELAQHTKHYDEAAAQFLRALELIQDEATTPEPPPADTIRDLHARASIAMSLARDVVKPTRRSGETHPYYQNSLRGVSVPRKNLQITFVYDSAEFDDRGARAAQQLLPILSKQSPKEVHVVGHTDSQGSDDYNLDLSKERAKAIEAYLVKNGFPGKISVKWCGESVPFPINNPQLYDQEETYRINRRVEVLYGAGARKLADSQYAGCRS